MGKLCVEINERMLLCCRSIVQHSHLFPRVSTFDLLEALWLASSHHLAPFECASASIYFGLFEKEASLENHHLAYRDRWQAFGDK